jgi:hypothetical protein
VEFKKAGLTRRLTGERRTSSLGYCDCVSVSIACSAGRYFVMSRHLALWALFFISGVLILLKNVTEPAHDQATTNLRK